MCSRNCISSSPAFLTQFDSFRIYTIRCLVFVGLATSQISSFQNVHSISWGYSARRARLPLDTRTRPWREWWPSYHKDSKAQSDEEAVQPWESWKFDPASPFNKPWYGWKVRWLPAYSKRYDFTFQITVFNPNQTMKPLLQFQSVIKFSLIKKLSKSCIQSQSSTPAEQTHTYNTSMLSQDSNIKNLMFPKSRLHRKIRGI